MLQETLKSRRPFMRAARKLSSELSEIGIRVAQWTNYIWRTEYSKSTSVLCVYIYRASTRLLEIGLARTFWVKLNRLRTGVGRFDLSVYKGGLAPSVNCDCGATEQTANHIISACLIHRTPRGMAGLTVWDDDTPCLFNTTTASI